MSGLYHGDLGSAHDILLRWRLSGPIGRLVRIVFIAMANDCVYLAPVSRTS